MFSNSYNRLAQPLLGTTAGTTAGITAGIAAGKVVGIAVWHSRRHSRMAQPHGTAAWYSRMVQPHSAVALLSYSLLGAAFGTVATNRAQWLLTVTFVWHSRLAY